LKIHLKQIKHKGMKTIKNCIKFSLMLIGLIFTAKYCYSQQKMSPLISGEIKGLPDNVKLSLIKGDDTEQSDTIQKSISKEGKFVFRNTGLIVGKMYFIILDTTILKLPSQRNNWIRFVVEANEIKIFGSKDTWPKVDFIGTNSTKVYEDYHAFNRERIKELNSSNKALREVLPDSLKFRNNDDLLILLQNDTSSLVSKFKQLVEGRKKFNKDFFRENATSAIVPLLIIESPLDLDEKESVFAALTETTKNSFYGKRLNKYLAVESIRTKVGVGKEIPDFNLTTSEGKVISIKGLVLKNKLTLIDFWASWCSPCRAAIPNLKVVYSKYKNQGFNIVGVVTSKNDKESAWKKAVAQDKTPWSQGMDMSNVTDTYFPKIGIPGYLLVDETGKIIATMLVDGPKGLGTQGPTITGEELAKTLEKLLGAK
jgi:thiol-disulfide isomerase/thioredoxin